MHAIINRIIQNRIVAVIRLDQYDRAVEIARALQAGGVTELEFTVTGAGANEAISAVRTALGDDVCVGVGSVMTAEATQAALSAGAQFVVTPVVQPVVINLCLARKTPVICGGLTPRELQSAYELGAMLVKLFPARLGGPAYVRDLLAPLPHLRIIPTGGVDATNAKAYLDAGAAAIGIGGNLVSATAVAAGDWAAISAAAQACRAAVSA